MYLFFPPPDNVNPVDHQYIMGQTILSSIESQPKKVVAVVVDVFVVVLLLVLLVLLLLSVTETKL